MLVKIPLEWRGIRIQVFYFLNGTSDKWVIVQKLLAVSPQPTEEVREDVLYYQYMEINAYDRKEVAVQAICLEFTIYRF